MGLIGTVVTVIVVGLIAGALARLLVPGRQSMSVGMTILLGIVGSFVGGFLGFLIFHKDASDGFLQPAGIIGAVIGSVIVLLIVGARGRRAVH
ncbi:GlsB/YeaQ/YmgE family stress response membrane protein [Kineococcus sp. GCM10028916]|uniref:GlsB/YeaQ/YmgE family stress response membrane protein n=1 Tax=Kineococcus sp. GCM10028916 TaxID=3273394 RepID=UPI00363BDC69